ncbi:MAG: hypothetical protein ACRDXX_21110 [Stackebrandtia sp.]
MSLKTVLAGSIVGGLVVLLVAPGAALADVDGSVSVSPTTVEPGGAITVSGKCGDDVSKATFWYADSNDVKLGGQDDVDGSKKEIKTTLTIGSSATTGEYTAYMQCDGDKQDAAGKATFTVSKSGTNAGGGAMSEGDNTFVLIGVGLLAAAAVAGVVIFQRRGASAPS